MSILLTVLGILLIIIGALLALASLVGYDRHENVRANITVGVAVVIVLGGAFLVATN